MTQRAQLRLSAGKRNLCVASFVVLGLFAGLVFWAKWLPSSTRGSFRIPQPPDLFQSEAGCSRAHGLHDFANELEQRARLRAERYPYDPQDGIESIRDFRRARDCYRSVGASNDATGAEAAAAMLQAQIQTDYASARVNLARALQSRRWTVVLAEARWLRRLTHHLGGHDYVEWLESVMGRASARRSAEP
ncbi:MAG: hypothetical protein PVH21_15160 [Myxococcales bacterium]|jgi:hypothetical protein